MLCAVCLWMFHRKTRSGLHHGCLDDLRKAAEGGCKICLVLLKKRAADGADIPRETIAHPFLEYKWGKDTRRQRQNALSTTFDSDVYWLTDVHAAFRKIDIHVSNALESVPAYYPEVASEAADDLISQPWKVRRERFPLRDIPNNTGHENVLGIARTWLNKCEDDHDCYMRDGIEDSKWLPKRLIDLIDPTAPRLVERDLERPSGRYATLSHCWGPEPDFLKLSRHNIDGLHGTKEEFDQHFQHPFDCVHQDVVSRDSFVKHQLDWIHIVIDYTSRYLTFPEKDKLVAFAAIARGFSAVFGKDYYAGHFRANMPADLAWNVEWPTPTSGLKRRNPPWSWTSLDCTIINNVLPIPGVDLDRNLAKIEEVRVELVDPSNKFGPVRSGEIWIRCFLMECSLIKIEEGDYCDTWTVGVVGHDVFDDPSKERVLHASQARLSVQLDETQVVLSDAIYFAPLVSSRKVHGVEVAHRVVLKRQTGTLFSRLGYWDTGLHVSDAKDTSAFLEYLNTLNMDQQISVCLI